MKKLLIIISIIFLWVIIFAGNRSTGWKPQNFPISFGDTIQFNKPFITMSGDTMTLLKLNDSIVIVVNGDTNRIDGGGSLSVETDPIFLASSAPKDSARIYDSIAALGGGIGSGVADSLQSFKQSKDTIRFTSLENPHDTINLDRNITLFLDTTNAYGYSATALVPVIGKGDFTKTLTITSNAEVLRVYDTIFRDSLMENELIIKYAYKPAYRTFKVRMDTCTIPASDVSTLYPLSFEIGTQNDSLINGLMSGAMTTAVKPQGDWNVTKNYTDDVLGIDTVYSVSDTLKIQLSAAVLSTDTLYVDYTEGDTLIYKLSNDSILHTFADSSVTNNVLNINDGLLAAYYFQGNTRDTSGNGYHLTVSGATLTTDKDANPNSAFSFNGSSDYMNINSLPYFNSISFWVEFGGSFVQYERPFAFNSNLFTLRVDETGGTDIYYNNTIYATGYTFPSASTWYHVVITLNGSNIYFYVDKIQKYTTTVTPFSSTNNLYLGQSGVSSQYLGGKLDDIRIFTDFLNTTEIDYLYNDKK